MAVNLQQRGLIQVASGLQQRAAPASAAVGGLPSGGGEEAARAEAKAFGSMSDEMGKLAQVVGGYADHAAQVEGRKEGHLAGMDPEFRPRNNGTIRGEAFDRAGLDTFKSTVSVQIENDIATAKSAGEIAAKKEGWLSRVPQELVPEVSHTFDRAVLTKNREAARAAVAQRAAEATASLATEMETLTKGIHQRAFALGLDPQADAVLSKDMGQIAERLARRGPDGKPLLSPEAAQKALRTARETVADARMLGAFDRLGSTTEREAFVKKVEEDFAGSKGLAAEYDFPRFERLQGRLRAHLNIARGEERQQQAVVKETIGRLEDFVGKGDVPTDAQLAGARAMVAGVSDPALAAKLAAVEDDAQFMGSARVHTLAQLDRYSASLERNIRENGPSERAQRRRALLKKVTTEMGAALKTDPLGWDEKVGLVKLAPIDLSSPEAATATLTQRIAQAEETARRHGISPVYLRPDEVQRWTAAASQGGDAMLDVARRITTGAGARAPAVLAQIHKEGAPVVALIGGHVRDLGETQVARDAAAGIALQKTPGFKGRAPSMDRAREEAVAAHKGALSGLPETEAALLVATNAAYEVRAQGKGLVDFDSKEWRRTFVELLGQRTDNDGEVYGGMANTRRGALWGGSAPVVVPPNIKQEQFRDLVDTVSIADFGTAPPRRGDGAAATVADIKAAALVQKGDGRYWLNIGTAEQPAYLRDSTNPTQPFVLDLKALEPKLRERRPGAYLGGDTAPGARPPGMMRLGLPPDPTGGEGRRGPNGLPMMESLERRMPPGWNFDDMILEDGAPARRARDPEFDWRFEIPDEVMEMAPAFDEAALRTGDVPPVGAEPPTPGEPGADDLPVGTPDLVREGLDALAKRLDLDAEGQQRLRQLLYTDGALDTLEQAMQAPNARVREFHSNRLLDLIERNFRATRR